MSEKKSDYTEKKIEMNIIQRFFIICSGADRGIIEQCPHEWNKYSGVGATIFFTAVLASLSGGYAIYVAFESQWISCLFAILWGMVILNLDRYIVLSMRKDDIPTKEDIERHQDENNKKLLWIKRKRLIWNTVYMASPRIIIALIIALTISKPVELRLFKGRIDLELVNMQNVALDRFAKEEEERIKNLNNQLATINSQEEDEKNRLFSNNPLYNNVLNKIKKLESDILTKGALVISNIDIINKNYYTVTKYRTVRNTVTGEETLEPYSVRLQNETAKAKEKENIELNNEINILKKELIDANADLKKIDVSLMSQTDDISEKYKLGKDNIQLQLDDLKNTYDVRRKEWREANEQSHDILAQLEALDEISKFGKTIWWASCLITLLFIAFETAPVVVKLLTPRGAYDEILDRVNHENIVTQKEIISRTSTSAYESLRRAEETARLEGDAIIAMAKAKHDMQITNNDAILKKESDYKHELALMKLEKWYKSEKKKVSENHVKPDDTDNSEDNTDFDGVN